MAEITGPWLRDVLARHDPLGAWTRAAGLARRDYQPEAELAARELRHLHGLGHARTLVADALDRLHPGVYQALIDGDPELERRLNAIARDVWERRGVLAPPARPLSLVPDTGAAVPPPPVAPSELVGDSELLTSWLREVEEVLRALPPGRVDARRSQPFHDALPALLHAYAAGSDDQRAATRVSFSRFRLVRYQLSAFVIAQDRDVQGPEPSATVRLALLAEALLDGGIDWRDELLVLRDLRVAALGAGVEFAGLLEEAVRCSGESGRRLLLSLRDGA